MTECRKLGLNVTQVEIKKCANQVIQFFSDARCVNGSEANLKSKVSVQQSTSLSGKPDDLILPFWKDIKQYESQRDQSECLVIRCNGIEAKKCMKGICTPSILLSAEDFNMKCFDKQMGKLLLEDKSVICIDTLGLNDTGCSRLENFICSMKDLFDGRVSIVVIDTGSIVKENLIEKHFDMNRNYTSMNKKRKHDSISDEQFYIPSNDASYKLPEVDQNLRLKEEEFYKLQEQVKELNKDLEKKNTEYLCLREELNIAEAKCSSLEQQLQEERDTHMQFSANTKLEVEYLKSKSLSDANIILESKNKIKELESVTRVGKTLNQETQTNFGYASLSGIDLILSKLNAQKGSDANVIDQVYSSIRDLKCNIEYNDNVGSTVQCSVNVVKGKHIMKYSNLLRFSGQGKSKRESLLNAFSNFVVSIENSRD